MLQLQYSNVLTQTILCTQGWTGKPIVWLHTWTKSSHMWRLNQQYKGAGWWNWTVPYGEKSWTQYNKTSDHEENMAEHKDRSIHDLAGWRQIHTSKRHFRNRTVTEETPSTTKRMGLEKSSTTRRNGIVHPRRGATITSQWKNGCMVYDSSAICIATFDVVHHRRTKPKVWCW